jgi:hypothetical protein
VLGLAWGKRDGANRAGCSGGINVAVDILIIAFSHETARFFV